MKFYNFFFIFFISTTIFTGFTGEALVKLPTEYAQLENLRINDDVACCTKKSHTNKITHKKKYRAPKGICIELPDNAKIICSFGQYFYLPVEDTWRPAHNLQVGQKLLQQNGDYITIQNVYEVIDDLKFYDISVKNCHTYFVTKHNILVHNFVPAIAIGATWLIGGGAVEFAGLSFGIAALGSLIGIKLFKGRRKRNRQIGNFEVGIGRLVDCANPSGKNNTSNEDEERLKSAGAPGIPTEKEGYCPPKGWDGKKRRHPDSGQIGWPDNRGGIWVPTGPAGSPLAHGGPHWDLIDKHGNHRNIRPGQKAY